ncbi:paraquat-inducible A protein [Herbaspirillum sp. GW103]|uniref:paraquat-inducible protein A n=1 Tax=unclassified Herbaspirillum TaxID=2624150 RepID=UPI00025E4E9B|nr:MULTISPECIES: paraquat-inducible protein A [unclassified Herbaspirillum]EIJ45809.1 paraquat-inducible A protein [Herbaspirillum sp. GW103]NUT61033.1 paraquat-inducible protein A [Herbaspirillum sp. C9C3]
MQKRTDLIVCEECDAVYQRMTLGEREVARCLRCGAELERDTGRRLQHLLPLTIAALILFVIANAFPIVTIELQGLSSQTTLIGAVVALTRDGMSEVALLVLATTLLFPLIQLGVLLYLLLPGGRQSRPPGFVLLLRLMQVARPWGMIEVFMLGVLVALIKLSNMAEVIPGPALWSFGGLTVLLTVVVSFNPRYLWHVWEQQQAGQYGDKEVGA